MTPFIHEDFLLETDVARDLYHRFVADLPIIDYHCHLPVAQIAGDHRVRSLTEVWLDGDHYKWRAMRANGVDASAPAMQPIRKSSRPGHAPSPRRCATRCTTGRIWS
jgi:glucuronate isomerase